MKSPQITGSTEAKVVDKAPPPLERRKAHKWLSSKNAEIYKAREREGFELYISKLAEEKIRNHAISHIDDRKEVMGLMLGGVYKDGGKEYALVRDVVTTDLEASAVRVRFHKSSFEKLFESLDQVGFDYVMVGWYHSHPGYGCFMSSTDVHTQKSMFNKRFHSAVVIDPIHKEIEAFYLKDGRVESRPFAVYWDQYQTPYYGTTARLRKLKSHPDGVPLPK